jgi:class 3 adenylate cyclase
MAAAAAATRRTVTVLFCDLADSTGLGEHLDPESLRSLLSGWYEAMRTAIERHGGTVEKFIGDAVMAVFGLPQVHEDDALRAVRAALEMRTALERLNETLEPLGRPPLRIRIGINSGEVVTGDGSTTLVTGDAVNTAKRLEQAAAADEILIGETTRRLVDNATELEPAPALSAKGKRLPVAAWRVVQAIAGAAPIARRLDARLVGRSSELARVRAEHAAAGRERTCRLLTVYGAAGIGKSRLARELLDAVRHEARVLTTRCLPYGDGLTFMPLTDLVRSVGSDEDIVRAVAAEPDAELIARRVRAAFESGTTQTTEETFWAIRRLLEALARDRPLLVCVEDVHWAQPTFLDLLEYVAGWSRDAPILILCLARPELLDARPRWGGTSITLEPLTEAEAQELLDELSAEWPVPPEALSAIAEAAEGNPLFVEQMVAMLAETGRTEVPPTIQALLAARLDQLHPLERGLLERAAVAGREFSRGAVADLSPVEERGAVGATLLALVRKELVRPQPSAIAGDDGFRFRHALIREAAYGEIPKSTRAELHERFADWLAAHGDGDELAGYHLEQAHGCRADLGVDDAATAERAARLLAAAGRRAFGREDMPAAANLLERALALSGLGGDRPAIVRELGVARWRIGDLANATAATDEAIELAAVAGDLRQEWHARLDRAARIRVQRGHDDDLAAVATEAVRVFGSLGDDRGLSQAWRRLALVSLTDWRFADAAEQAGRALEHARRAGDGSENAGLADVLCTALLFGAEPADAASRRCLELLDELEPAQPVTAAVSSTLAVLRAMQGSFAESRALRVEAAAIYDGLGARLQRAGLAELSASAELLAGDLEAAERELRHAFGVFLDVGSTALAGFNAARLARLAVGRDGLDAADERLGFAREHVDQADLDGLVELRLAEAHVALAHGRRDEALQLAEEACAAVGDTESLTYRAEAAALRAAILDEEPAEAVELYERKGNVAAAARLRALVTAKAPR